MTIDVFADIACPWCYIGEAHLEAALHQRPELAVERRWRPFQLQPGLPRTGAGRDFFTRKFGGEAQTQAAFDHVARAGQAAGLQFDFARLAGAPNTLDAHRLVLLGRAQGREWETVQALFEGYFADGRDLNDPDDLAAIADRAGLPGADARTLLDDDRFKADVALSQAAAQRSGISGVPLYLIGNQLALSGAQPVEAFVRALDHVTGPVATGPAASAQPSRPGAP